MSFDLSLSLAALLAAAVPAALFWRNLRVYLPPPSPASWQPVGPWRSAPAAVSVLIPARDEEATLGAAVDSVLANTGVDLEILVLDDGSRDATAEIVRRRARRDPRLRLLTGPPLPAGWCGKQHACAVLARHATQPVLVFLDADVRLAPDAVARVAEALRQSGAGLVSGFPRQETGTWLEKLLIPLIHFVLLGFLPLDAMRRFRLPGFGAACGQLIAVRRDAYEAAGGHGSIRGSLHDGLELPRAFRRAGFATDLFDATGVAVCRMYHGAAQVWAGLAKNATEGLGAPGTIVPMTGLLLTGQVLPAGLVAAALLGGLTAPAAGVAVLAAVLAWTPRLAAARRFRQPLGGALAHPLGVTVLLAIQWWALGRSLLGRPASWKGRSYEAA
jgi:hypothetical protein